MKLVNPLAASASLAETMERLRALDWDFDGADTRADGHGAHPYPAKFPPQLPAQVIAELSSERDLVVDPFGGSGTTALEALRQGRRAHLVDANPVGVRLSRVKALRIGCADERVISALCASVAAASNECATRGGACPLTMHPPAIPNITKWFAPESVHELTHLREMAAELSGTVRDLVELAIGQAAAKVSFQESETRYVSAPRAVTAGEAFAAFRDELKRLSASLCGSSAIEGGAFAAVQGDSRDFEAWRLSNESAALIITSPPYPNAYDYHLYHRFRLLWTESDPSELRRVEIGSHLRQQSVSDPIGDFEDDMRAVLANCFLALRPGGWCVFVVGDGKYRGKLYSTSAGIERIAADVGFAVGGSLTRLLPTNKRSVTSAGRRLTDEQIVVMRKPARLVVEPPRWEMFPYETALAAREFALLATRDPGRLTFASAVQVEGIRQSTIQYLLEASDGSRRKNSTYATHGIHRYKGKFYPQLARCLINLSCEPHSLVVDPFTGSGTVALEAAMLGHHFHGIELSPVGWATATTKIAALRLSPPALDEATAQLKGLRGATCPPAVVDWQQFPETTHKELRSWFAASVLARISAVLCAVRALDAIGKYGSTAARLGEVCLSDLIREVSHQDPSDLRIRRRKDPLEDAPVEDLFIARWDEAVRKIKAAQAVLPSGLGEGRIALGDSTMAEYWPSEPVDAIVTSPPYAAALPYIDTDRLSLAAVFGYSSASRGHLEERLVGSREISKRKMNALRQGLADGLYGEELPSSTTAFLQALGEAVDADADAGFRRIQGPAVLTRYFLAMSRVLEQAAAHLRSGGQAWFVVGNSRTTVGGRTWEIPTTQEVASIAKFHGLDLVEEVPITVTRENMRHARNAITDNMLLHFEMR